MNVSKLIKILTACDDDDTLAELNVVVASGSDKQLLVRSVYMDGDSLVIDVDVDEENKEEQNYRQVTGHECPLCGEDDIDCECGPEKLVEYYSK